MKNYVITIGRQCGSGGHSIGKALSQRLGIPFYDKEIIELTAKESMRITSRCRTRFILCRARSSRNLQKKAPA